MLTFRHLSTCHECAVRRTPWTSTSGESLSRLRFVREVYVLLRACVHLRVYSTGRWKENVTRLYQACTSYGRKCRDLCINRFLSTAGLRKERCNKARAAAANSVAERAKAV